MVASMICNLGMSDGNKIGVATKAIANGILEGGSSLYIETSGRPRLN